MKTAVFGVSAPNEMEGTPYEVVERAMQQTTALLRLTHESLIATRVMVCNAEMQRQIDNDGAPSALAFEASVLARKIDELSAAFEAQITSLGQLTRAAAFDPKARF